MDLNSPPLSCTWLFASLWKIQSRKSRERFSHLVLYCERWGQWEHLNPLKQILPRVLAPRLIATGTSSSHSSVASSTVRDGKIRWWVSWVLLTAGAERAVPTTSVASQVWDSADTEGGVRGASPALHCFPLFYFCTPHLAHCNIHASCSHPSTNILAERA